MGLIFFLAVSALSGWTVNAAIVPHRLMSCELFLEHANPSDKGELIAEIDSAIKKIESSLDGSSTTKMSKRPLLNLNSFNQTFASRTRRMVQRLNGLRADILNENNGPTILWSRSRGQQFETDVRNFEINEKGISAIYDGEIGPIKADRPTLGVFAVIFVTLPWSLYNFWAGNVWLGAGQLVGCAALYACSWIFHKKTLDFHFVFQKEVLAKLLREPSGELMFYSGENVLIPESFLQGRESRSNALNQMGTSFGRSIFERRSSSERGLKRKTLIDRFAYYDEGKQEPVWITIFRLER